MFNIGIFAPAETSELLDRIAQLEAQVSDRVLAWIRWGGCGVNGGQVARSEVSFTWPRIVNGFSYRIDVFFFWKVFLLEGVLFLGTI